MIESLGPLVSFFKLLLQGIAESWKAIKSAKNKAIQRKLLEIQLSLEDIIDNADHLLVLIEESSDKGLKEDSGYLEEFKSGLYAQIQRLNIFLNQVSDPTSGELLRLFAPDVRRKISLLIETKMSAVYVVLRAMYDIKEKAKLSKDGLTFTIQSALLEWDHKKFVTGGEIYLSELGRHSKKANFLVADHLQQQRRVINDLTQCSKEFSEFLKAHVSVQDAVHLLRKKD
jgi:hypothetical protein